MLEQIEVEDVLGFSGRATFAFAPGLTVLEAPNHTGKTSLALATLWALTGSVPRLGRVNRTSFRLTNRHAGSDAEPRVALKLVTSAGRRMRLDRSYAARARSHERLELEVDGECCEGLQAATRLAAELGLDEASLEGIGVVLQDQRHALVAGGESELSAVLNNVLGLEVLAEVVPVLQEARRDAVRLARDVEKFTQGDDPIRRWELEERRLAEAFRTAEKRAFQTGFEAAQLEAPDALLWEELEAVGTELGREEEFEPGHPQRALEELREDLRTQRAHSPLSRRADDLASRRRAAEALRRAWAEERRRLSELEQSAPIMSSQRESAQSTASEAGAEIERCTQRRRELEAEQQLLQVAFDHVSGHSDDVRCPVCEQGVVGAELLASIGSRLDERLVRELEELGVREAQARAELVGARELEASYATWQRELERFGLDLEARLRKGELEGQSELAALAGLLAEGDLVGDGALRTALDAGLAQLVERAVEVETRARGEEDRARTLWQRQEAEVFQPIERRLERVRERLLPLVEAGSRIEAHGRLRDVAEERASELERVAVSAAGLSRDLEALARALSEHERERAAGAVARCEPLLSSFFARIAENPDYTGLSIATEIVRGKVAYRLRASSSKIPGLDDAAGHVLSEGDLSAAAIALLLALAIGATHRMGFLLLDDPAQGMDSRLAASLARELAGFEGRPQTIVLTHQSGFAAQLAGQGAAHQRLESWADGRVQLALEPPDSSR